MEVNGKEGIFLRYGDSIMLYSLAHLQGRIQGKKMEKVPLSRAPVMASFGFMDERLRIDFAKYDSNIGDIDPRDIYQDAVFRDKLFIIVPELLFDFQKELREFDSQTKVAVTKEISAGAQKYLFLTQGYTKKTQFDLQQVPKREGKK
jgi:hypothetical protein